MNAPTTPPSTASTIDWSCKPAVLHWIREQVRLRAHSSAALEGLPFSCLPASLRGDLDIGLAIAEIHPASLVKLSPALLKVPEIARRAIARESSARHLFMEEVLEQADQRPASSAESAEPSGLASEQRFAPEAASSSRPWMQPRKPTPYDSN